MPAFNPDLIPATLLANAVRKRPALYDSSKRCVMGRCSRKKFWEEVSQEIYPDWNSLEEHVKIWKGREIRRRWKRLRDCFVREVANQAKSSIEGYKPRKTYVYYDLLSFLLPTLKDSSSLPEKSKLNDGNKNSAKSAEIPRRASTDISSDTDSIESAIIPRRSLNQISRNSDSSKFVETPRSALKYVPHNSTSNAEMSATTSNISSQSIFEQATSLCFSPVTKASPPVQLCSTSRTQKRCMRQDECIDDDRAFLLSLLPSLKQFDGSQKLTVRIEIMNAIRKVQLSSGSSRQNPY